MAVVYDNTASAVGGTATSVTYSLTVNSGSNGAIAVGVEFGSATLTLTVASVTYNGVNLGVAALATAYKSLGRRCEAWGAINSTTGAHNIVATLSGGSGRINSGAVSATGVDQTTPLTGTGATGTSATPSVNVTSAVGGLVMDTLCAQVSTSLTVDASQTQRWNQDGNRSGGSTETGAATVTMSWTLGSSVEWAICGAAFKALSTTPLTQTASDQETLTDALTSVNLGLLTSFSDTETLSDAINRMILGSLATFSDTETLSDAARFNLGLRTTFSDSETLTDSASLNVGSRTAFSDSLSLLDAGTLRLTFNPAFSEIITFSDAIAPNLGFLTNFNDSVSLLDAVKLGLGTGNAFSDTLSFTDSVALSLGSPFIFLNFSDTLIFSDSIQLPNTGINLQDSVVLQLLDVYDVGNLNRIRRYLNDLNPPLFTPVPAGNNAPGPNVVLINLQDSVALELSPDYRLADVNRIRRYLNDVN